MRRSIIVSTFAVAMAAAAGGVVAAAEPGDTPSPAAATTVPFGDMFSSLGLSPEQGSCLVSGITSVDASDVSAVMNLMTECGISLDQLTDIAATGGLPGLPSLDAVAAPTTVAGAVPELDAAAAAAVLAFLGIDQPTLDCLAAQATTVTPGDDSAAETVLVGCGLSASGILDGLVGLNTLASGVTSPVTIPADITATTAAAAGGIVDMIQQQLTDQFGITLEDDQVQCLVDNISSFDPNDINSMLTVMESCGINLTDLAGG